MSQQAALSAKTDFRDDTGNATYGETILIILHTNELFLFNQPKHYHTGKSCKTQTQVRQSQYDVTTTKKQRIQEEEKKVHSSAAFMEM